MARIPASKLKNLRSGQTVWRVWGHMYKDGSFDIEATPIFVVGKKVNYNMYGGYYSLKMIWKRFEETDAKDRYKWMYEVAYFLSDLDGFSCFDTKRSADRFVKEVKEGLHPEIVESMRRRMEDDTMWDEMDDFFDEDRRELLFSDEDEEPAFETDFDDDESWNNSLGHGA